MKMPMAIKLKGKPDIL